MSRRAVLGSFSSSAFVVATLALGSSDSARAEDHGAWIADIEVAKKQAKEQGKDLFIEFTGSDWCAPCMRLWKETFSQDAFQSEITKTHVLVVVDNPKDPKKLTPELKTQSDLLHVRFAVNRWPTIFLADPEGRPYARTDDYSENTPAAWLAWAKEKQGGKARRDAALAEAAKLEGVAKAKKLDEALSVCGEFCPTALYPAEIDAIAAADPNDESGAKQRWFAKRMADELEVDLPKLGKAQKWDELASRIETFLTTAKPAGEVKQKALFWQGTAYARLGKKDDAKKSLEAAVALGADLEFGKRAAAALSSVK